MGTIFIRALILYFVVIFSVRLMGKRQLGELQPSELVITILISNIATLPLEDTGRAGAGTGHYAAARHSAHSVDGLF